MKPPAATIPRPIACTVACTLLLLSSAAAIAWSWQWPLLGDASLMHYVVFLIHRGFTPYKDIVDVNLPGSYLFEAAAMSVFGWGDLGWRIYDLVLLLIVCTSAVLLTRRQDWFAGLFAGTLFLLIHIQDGIVQLGQRDLLIAALLLCAYAALFAAQRSPRSSLSIFLFGLLIGFTFIIKPLFLLLGVILLLSSIRQTHRRSLPLALGLAGMALPALCTLLWLQLHHALPAFLHILATLIQLHAELGRKPLSYLLAHSLSPIAPLCALWLILWILLRPTLTLERLQLLLGIAFALVAYIAQGKGYPYHRYPLLTLLLILIGTDLAEALRRPTLAKSLATLALAFASLVIAPRAAWLAHSFSAAQPFQQALAADLTQAASQLSIQLSSQVQCLDTFGGCINTLYNLRVPPSTGFLYDCYLFTPHQNEAAQQYRAAFWQAYKAARPRIIVLTTQFCFGDPGGFSRIDAWPQLREDLEHSYTQTTEWHSNQPQHWWARKETPAAYRIYLRNP